MSRNIIHIILVLPLFLASCVSTSVLPTPTITVTSVPSPTLSPAPTALSASTPVPSLSFDHAPVLRPDFVTDLNSFPDATRYEIELTIDLDAAIVVGHAHIDYTNTEDVPLGILYLRLLPNTPGYGGMMMATNITLDGSPVEPVVELDDSALRLPINPSLEPGAHISLNLDFDLALPTEIDQGYGQLGYYDEVLALANGYPLVPVYDDEGWNVEMASTYGDAVYSETAFYTVRITAPADTTLIASGVCDTLTSAADDLVTWDCFTGPMRDFNAILGADYRVVSRVVDGVTVNSFFTSGHREGGERVLDWAAEAVRIFDARFGPYPFTELDVVETPTRAGGIEYPGLVVINRRYYETLSERMEWVVVHETGHQWWYSLVGNDQVDEPWLDEALVQYSTLLYYEEYYGPGVAADLLKQIFQLPYEGLMDSGGDMPVGLPVAAYSSENYGTVVYQKGPLYFHALRQEVGDERFWAILQTYFDRNRYAVAAPEDWLAAVEAAAGDEYRDLYERWIVGVSEERK